MRRRHARYKHIAMPAPDVNRPINPKSCSGLVIDVRQNFTVIRSNSTRTVREIPYLDRPMQPWAMLDGQFRNASTVTPHQRGDEPMHLAIEAKFLHEFCSISLQGTAIVVEVDAGRVTDEPVC